jgi:hypothetical protein
MPLLDLFASIVLLILVASASAIHIKPAHVIRQVLLAQKVLQPSSLSG